MVATAGGETFASGIATLAQNAPKQEVCYSKLIRFGPVDLAAFGSLPIAPAALLTDVIAPSPQGIGRIDFPTYRTGGGLFVKPFEVAHRFRALRAEGGAKSAKQFC